MKETDFINQNNEKWRELEALNKEKSKDPVKLSDLFIEVTNDLSFSKTHYANRSIKVYLNNLALGIHSRVYRNRLGAGKRFKTFWTNDLPKVMYESRKSIFLAFILFAIAMAIGVLSSMNDPGFARHILGDSYVNMTEEFIESGDPMAVYKQSKNVDMFVYISINNLRVSFLVFVLGAFFGVGTIAVLVYNGIMVGAFQYFFIERGLFQESFLTIWMHGMPEIMSIVLAGAAGLTLGSGLLFPKTYSRKESFLISARRGIMMMVGISPVFIFAAFIEGFATRFTEIPDVVRAIVILLSASFMVYYFVIYPWMKFGRNQAFQKTEDKVPASTAHDYEWQKDKRNARIYADIFALYSSTVFYLLSRFIGLTIAYVLALVLFSEEGFKDLFTSSGGGFGGDPFSTAIGMTFIKVDQLFRYMDNHYMYVINSVAFSFVAMTALWQWRLLHWKTHGQEEGGLMPFIKQTLPTVLLASFLTNTVFFLPTPWSFLVLLFVMPIILQLVIHPVVSKVHGDQFGETIKQSFNYYGRHLGLFLMTMVTAILFMLIFSSGLMDLLLEVFLWNFKMEADTYNVIMLSIRAGLTILSLSMVTPLFLYASSFGHLAAYEMRTAAGLHSDVSKIGTLNRAYGLLKEES